MNTASWATGCHHAACSRASPPFSTFFLLVAWLRIHGWLMHYFWPMFQCRPLTFVLCPRHARQFLLGSL